MARAARDDEAGDNGKEEEEDVLICAHNEVSHVSKDFHCFCLVFCLEFCVVR